MINKVTLVGRLGNDSKISQSKAGKDYTLLSVATTSSHKDAQGNWKEETSWHSVTAWWKIDAKKGETVYVEGELTYYTNAESVKTAQIRANTVKVISHKGGAEKVPQNNYSAQADFGDDLPF